MPAKCMSPDRFALCYDADGPGATAVLKGGTRPWWRFWRNREPINEM